MNKTTLYKLEKAAPFIEKYRQLDETEKKWLINIIDYSVLTAICILESIETQPLTYEEIAKENSIHPTSVQQIIAALAGHISINFDGKKAYAPIGRKRKLLSRTVLAEKI